MKKTESQKLFEELKAYQPTQTEAERETQRLQKIAKNRQRRNELYETGTEIVRHYHPEDVIFRHFKESDAVEAMMSEIRQLDAEYNALKFMPVQDDEYISICEKLDAVTAKKTDIEKRYSEALREHENARGKIPFDLYKQTEEECYQLSEELEKLKSEEEKLLKEKSNYQRKSDGLFDAYMNALDAEVSKNVTEKVSELIAYLNDAMAQRDEAERMTAERRGVKDAKNQFLLPYNGDSYKLVLHRLEQILKSEIDF